MSKVHTETIERISDKRIQVQRKNTVVEEYERTYKQKRIEIKKNEGNAKMTYPFQKVKTPEEEQGIIGLHTTNLQLICSSFLKKEQKVIEQQSVTFGPVQKPQAQVAPIAKPIMAKADTLSKCDSKHSSPEIRKISVSFCLQWWFYSFYSCIFGLYSC